MPRNIVVYAAMVAIAAPIIPYGGMRRGLRAMFTIAAAPVTTQLNRVRRARPTPIATTMYPAKATVENASGPTTRDDSSKSGAAIHWTIQGDRSARPVATQVVSRTRYVRTKAYARRAAASSSIEYAKAGHARRNAVSRSTRADAIRTPTE